MVLIEDTGNKKGRHAEKHMYWSKNDVDVWRYGLPVGDYILANDSVTEMLARKKMRGIAVKKMDFLGTYNAAVDTKFGIQELVGNICGKQHERFRDELCLAKNNGIKLYILVDDDGCWCDKNHTVWNDPVTCIDDLFKWKNPRAFIWRSGKRVYPMATKGSTLAKAVITCEKKYCCKFVFGRSKDAGAKVISLLTDGME